MFLLPGCILAWGWRSAARWLRLFACPQYYRVSNICHLRHLWRTKPHKTGFIGWARHCCCASLRTCSHLSSIFDSPKFLMVIDTPYNHSFDDLSMSTTRSWMFANHIYLHAGKTDLTICKFLQLCGKAGPRCLILQLSTPSCPQLCTGSIIAHNHFPIAIRQLNRELWTVSFYVIGPGNMNNCKFTCAVQKL